jgi:HEPN domain-containing protein
VNPLVLEWIQKAESDFAVASREASIGAATAHDAIWFHAQQCIEKLMKAVLLDRGVTAPRTHDLVHLDELLRGVIPSWAWDLKELAFLNEGAVAIRYPGAQASPEAATSALHYCNRLRSALLPLVSDAGSS